MERLKNVRVILTETTHPGNIGATARAMGNMGLSRLYLVKPQRFPDAQATARAAGATSVLEGAAVVDSLKQAIGECRLVIGTTARLRSVCWPQLALPDAMARVVETGKSSPVALVFGRESRGLTNAELDCCNFLVRIPVDEEYSSLNLAAAVMVVAYELRKAAQEERETGPAEHDLTETLATAEELRHFYDHLRRVMEEIAFVKGNPVKLLRKLVRLFNRARPTYEEISILRGFLTAVERANEP